MGEAIEIGGYMLELDGGRTVWVAQHDGKYFIKFENPANDPPVTRVCLSAEAAEAMVTCYGHASGKSKTLAFALKDGGWQLVQRGLWAAAEMLVEVRKRDGSASAPSEENT